jgi:hypothetical protein
MGTSTKKKKKTNFKSLETNIVPPIMMRFCNIEFLLN